MKTRFISGVLFLFLLCPVTGQQTDQLVLLEKSNSLELHTGLNQIKEMNLLPVSNSGLITEFSFAREKRGKQLHQFQISIAYSRLKTRFEDMAKSGNIGLSIYYAKNWHLIQEGNISYFMGPHASISYSFMLYPNWDDSHGYWANTFSAGMNNILSVKLRNNQEWFTSLKIPLFSLYSRPEVERLYKMDDSSVAGLLKSLNGDIESGTWNRAFQLNFVTEYRFPVFSNKMEALSYSIDFMRISKRNGSPVIQLINKLGIKFMF